MIKDKEILLLLVLDKKASIKVNDPQLALVKMQGWCAYQERSQQDARDKLYDLGLWPEAVELIISKLIEENFLNEERFAMTFARGKFSIKKWGRIKIKQELKQKRVSEYCLKKALQQIDETLYLETLTRLLEVKRKLIREKNPVKLKFKLMNYALAKGYEKDLVFDVLNNVED
ncbi:MAG: RecX family transcriptional regulator [Bacteroidota bacterium]|nr:RecX family transcriptional regulator [Bacteroidota bacterium]